MVICSKSHCRTSGDLNTYFSVLSITPSAMFLGISLPKVVSVETEIAQLSEHKTDFICDRIRLTQNGIHDDQSHIMFYVEFSFIAFLSELLDALDDTFVEYWNVTVQNWQTERRIYQFPLLLPSVS